MAKTKIVRDMPYGPRTMSGLEFKEALEWLFGGVGCRTIFSNAVGVHRETIRANIEKDKISQPLALIMWMLIELRMKERLLPIEFYPYTNIDERPTPPAFVLKHAMNDQVKFGLFLSRNAGSKAMYDE